MDTKIISFANQKGGCGKTTLTMQLAGALSKTSKSILIVDADPQATSIRWASSATETKPFPATVCGLSAAGTKVHHEVKKYLGKYEYILIDCPPAIDSLVPQSALLISDLVLIPIVPSPADLWAAVGIQELIEKVKILNENLQARIILNMCQSNTSLTEEISKMLDNFKIPKLRTTISLRTAYKQAGAFGNTVLDIKGADKAAKEILSLTEEILQIL